MPIRPVKQQSDRGSIKDLQNGDDEKFPPTSYELRMKKLYEHALVSKNQTLIDSLGFIAVNEAPKDPVSVYRHREYIKKLEANLADKLEQTKQELAGCFIQTDAELPPHKREIVMKQLETTAIILGDKDIVKVAHGGSSYVRQLRSFRRVI